MFSDFYCHKGARANKAGKENGDCRVLLSRESVSLYCCQRIYTGGRAEGRVEGITEAVRKMVKSGMTREAVAEVLQLQITEIDAMLQ